MFAKELLRFPYDDGTTSHTSLQKGQQIVYTFNKTANFYPQGLNDTIWRLRSISSSKNDVKVNDTSLFINVNSRGQSLTLIHYGTWEIGLALII